MKNDLSVLTDTVQAKSAAFFTRMRRYYPSLICDVGHYSNEAFLLRSFVSLRCDNQADELALAIDVTVLSTSDTDAVLSVECDVCLDNGTIVATGPSRELVTSSPTFEQDVLSWGKEFDAFISESKTKVADAGEKMIATRHSASIDQGAC